MENPGFRVEVSLTSAVTKYFEPGNRSLRIQLRQFWRFGRPSRRDLSACVADLLFGPLDFDFKLITDFQLILDETAQPDNLAALLPAFSAALLFLLLIMVTL